MMSELWSRITRIAQDWCAVCSISINFYLVLLIKFRSPPKLGNYKYLMMYISSFHIVHSAIAASIKPIVFSYKSLFVVLVDLNYSLVDNQIAELFNGKRFRVETKFKGSSSTQELTQALWAGLGEMPTRMRL
ncbi:unnamed protein product [Caenorhabditis bovis]|uniref:Uncharacterized protein n=1 Tax=Caenorhabditis bovis TaxID=2654633 RepID=A0A8S1FC70_9PELO|nr:unnamed protein product [Caenorhabditis bovis]